MGWYNKYSPGFICVGKNPHPFGNERHMILFSLELILWKAHIVEGRDRSLHRGGKQRQDLGKTVGLMLQM